MFTGQVETIGMISLIEEVDVGAHFEIYAPEFGRDLAIGDSVCANGVALPIAAFARGAFVAEASFEKLDHSVLGELRVEDKVNLERALRLSDRLTGHFVTGHIDGIGELVQKQNAGNATVYQFELPQEFEPYLIPGAYITINGVSLTIGRVNENLIAISVVSVVEKATTLPLLEVGERVNIEIDLFAKYARRFSGFYEPEY